MESLSRLVSFGVTPRFDLFYALRTLHGGGEAGKDWRAMAKRALPAKFESAVDRVAPRAMMWPLLADALRDAKTLLTLDDIVERLRSLQNEPFQRALLDGIFRRALAVEGLISKRQSLRAAVSAEVKHGNQLMSLVGLEPFRRASAVVSAFTRIVTNPAEYRADLARVLEIFSETVFAQTWQQLEPQMKDRVAQMNRAHRSDSMNELVERHRLPVAFDNRSKMVVNSRGTPLFSFRDVRAIHFLPSAFNDSRLWAAYVNASGAVTLYFPVFDATLLPSVALTPTRAHEDRSIDPALGFRALGDTTRYAIASLLARGPRTSAELAKSFSVSKATISHHVQLLRGAGLLAEEQTERGVVLRLDRDALESLSGNAAQEMFSGNDAPVIRRSRHEKNIDKAGQS